MAEQRKEDLKRETLLIKRAHGNAVYLVSIPNTFTALYTIGRKRKTWV